jgi:hypothetical protein
MKAICGLKCISGLSFQQMTTQMQQDCSERISTRHSASNASQAHDLQTPSDGIPAFVQHSSSNASQAYGLHTPRDAIPSFGQHSPGNAL